MLAAGSSVHLLLGVCPARTRDDCTRYSPHAHKRTVILPEAQPEALSRPTPVSPVVTATTARPPMQAKLLRIEGAGRSVGCHVATAGRLHGHRVFKPVQ